MPLCGNSRCAASIHFLVYPVGKSYASKVDDEKTAFEQGRKHRQNGHKKSRYLHCSCFCRYGRVAAIHEEILISMWDGSIIQLDKLEFGEVRMKIEKCTKDAFVVIGKEGSTLDGQGFIQKLWTDASSHFSEVQPLAKKDEKGNLVGIWGAMSDCSHSYKPWEENFSKGLYLAGVECVDDAEAPEGWTKWKIPGYEYLYAEVESESTFSIVLDYMNTNNIVLAGAVHDFTCPLDGKNYMFFPIRTI